MDVISVVIADDHVIFRKGLSTILNEIVSVKVVGEASNGHELMEVLKKISADVVLMDIRMPGMDGIEATKKLTERYPDIHVIALTMHEEIGYFNRMIDAGARGFLLKKTNRDQLEEAILTVAAGQTYFAEEFQITVDPGLIQAASPKIALTDREKEILELICKGHSNPEIGKLLGLSARTIDGHRSRLFEKTGAKNAPSLVMYAIRNRLVRP